MAAQSSEAQLAPIFEDAKRKYTELTGHPIESLGDIPTDSEGLMRNINDRCKEFGAFRKKWDSVHKVLKPFVELVNGMAETLGEGIPLIPVPGASFAKPVFKAITALIAAAKQVEKSYDYIHELFESLFHLLSRYKIYLEHKIALAIKDIMVETLAHMLIVFGNATKAIKEGRTRQFFKTIIGKGSEVETLLRKFTQLTIQEERLVSATVLSLTNQVLGILGDQTEDDTESAARGTIRKMLFSVGDTVKKLDDNSEKVRSMMEAVRSAVFRQEEQLGSFLDRQKLRDYLDWLSAPDMTSNHKAASGERMKGTGNWILQSPQFQRWKNEEKSYLWIQGGPGFGKTVLSSTVIDELRYTVPIDTSALAYQYFDSRDSSKQSYESLLRSFLKQLLVRSSKIPDAFQRLYGHTLGPLSESSVDVLQSTLCEILQETYEHVYLIVDALDECAGSESSRVATFLGSLSELPIAGLHVLITGRPQTNVLQSIDPIVPLEHRIDLRDHPEAKKDIMYYIHSYVRGDHANSTFKCLSADILAQIEEKLVQKADGMFRWVYCQIKALRACKTAGDILDALKTLPSTLDETYERILRKIPDVDRKYARRILFWLAFSLRPLSIGEVAEATSLEFSESFDPKERPAFAPSRRLLDVWQVFNICSNLVVIVGPLDPQRKVSLSSVVELAHTSVKEYLIKAHNNNHDSSMRYFHLNSALAHDIIAHACLIYLMETAAQYGLTTQPLTEYAATSWISHLTSRRVDHPSQALRTTVLEFNEFTKRPTLPVCLWLEIWRQYRDYSFRRKPAPSLLYCAAVQGSQPLAELMLSTGENVNVQGGYFGNALQAALYNEHTSIARLLIDNKADVNALGGRYNNALQTASYRGDQDIIRLLISKGATVDKQGGCYHTALQAAAAAGHEDVVQLLLNERADVNAKGGRYGSALQAAAYCGASSIVDLLIRKNADVNGQKGAYSDALQAASYSGNIGIVQLLLRNEANINAQGGMFSTALQVASYHGHIDIVELLLETGANVNAEVNAPHALFASPLQAAAFAGHKEIVQLLLTKKANVNAQGGMYGNALQAAAHGGNPAFMHQLLIAMSSLSAAEQDYQSLSTALHELLQDRKDAKRRSSPQQKSNPERSTLNNLLPDASKASAQNYGEIVQLLLEAKSNVNANGGHYGSALQAACHGGNETIVQLLLEEKADVNATEVTSKYGNAIQAASRGGHTRIVKLLFDHKANVHAEGAGKYGNALQAASVEGAADVVEFLLDKGCNPNARGGYYGNALQAAASNGDEGIVKSLLKAKADVNFQGGHHGNALQAALDCGHKRIAMLLLNEGAEVNEPGRWQYKSALQAASYRGYKDVVEELLKKGADVNAEGGDKDHGTALQAASSAGHIEIVKLLLKHQANVNARVGKYKSALEASKWKGHRKITVLLQEHGATPLTPKADPQQAGLLSEGLGVLPTPSNLSLSIDPDVPDNLSDASIYDDYGTPAPSDID